MSVVDLSSHPFFRTLRADLLNVVGRIVREDEFADGDILFRQGEAAGSVLFVLEGSVSIVARLPGGDGVEIAQVEAGEVLGELGLMADHRRAATAVARGPVRAAVMESADLSALCAHYHPASLQLLRELAMAVARRLRDTTESASHLVTADGCRAISGTGIIAPGAPYDFQPFLPLLGFFRDFGPAEREEFVALCTVFTAPRGCRIRGPGEADHHLYVILRGAVQTSLVTDAGTLRTAVLGPGRAFGEVNWLLGDAAAVQVTAMSQCTFLRLSPDCRVTLMDPASRLSFRFYQGLLRGLQVKLDAQSREFARREQMGMSGTHRWQS